MTILFWISLSFLFFCYLGYGFLLFFCNAIKRAFLPGRKKIDSGTLLPVTLIVAAYNEEAVLVPKIKNTLAIDYPADKLQVIFVTDGSTDNSALIIRDYPTVILIEGQERRGKSAAIQTAMHLVKTPIVVFSDANTLLNAACLRKMVVHYANEKVGGVAGEKKILNNDDSSAVGRAEGLYWQYESFMKKQDAEFNTVVGAAGELYSIRTALYKEMPGHLILDDFVTSMQICLQGYRIAYEPGAFATELPSASLREEQKRKERIAAGAYQSIGYLKGCLAVFKHPLLSFQYISRRFLRWVCCPLLLVTMMVSNILIVNQGIYSGWYSWFLIAQLIFYLSAAIGWLMVNIGKGPGLLVIPFYFVFMNYCLVRGFIMFIKGKHTVLWEKSRRAHRF